MNYPSIYPDPTDEVYQLEQQVDQLSQLTPNKQIGLLYNDANNYLMGLIPPFEAWYTKREIAIREYASLNWLGLGEHLKQNRPSMYSMCSAIHDTLQLLLTEVNTQKRFQLTIFCSVMAQMDRLWHILLPSDYTPLPEDPAVIHLLRYFNQLPNK